MSDFGFAKISSEMIQQNSVLRSEFATAGRNHDACGTPNSRRYSVYDDVVKKVYFYESPLAAAMVWHRINKRELSKRCYTRKRYDGLGYVVRTSDGYSC